MCFVTNNPKLKKRLAKHDIKVGKIVDSIKATDSIFFGNRCRSCVNGYVYIKDKLNPEIPIELKTQLFIINKRYTKDYIGERGYHSYRLGSVKRINALFVIPKGSYYYYDRVNKEYFSSNIIYKRPLTKGE